MTKKYDLYDLDNSFTEYMIEWLKLFLIEIKKSPTVLEEEFEKDINSLILLLEDYRNWWDKLYHKYKWKDIIENEEKEYKKMMKLLTKVYRSLWI